MIETSIYMVSPKLSGMNLKIALEAVFSIYILLLDFRRSWWLRALPGLWLSGKQHTPGAKEHAAT
jgi:hypothetical protein